MSLTNISGEPKPAKNAIDMVSRIDPKYHFPSDLGRLEHTIRMCLGLPITHTQGRVPFGYVLREGTEHTYDAVPEVYKYLWQARRYLYTSSIREVTDWLNNKVAKIGHPQQISHMGLRNLMILRPVYEEALLPNDVKEKLLTSLTKWNKQTV